MTDRLLVLLGKFGLRPSDEQLTPGEIWVGRKAVGLLAAEWMLFGSAHFSFPHQTAAQLPCFIPFRDGVATISGMIEVTIGTLILFTRTRTIAAALSLVLLIIYILPVFTILSSTAAQLQLSDWPAWTIAVVKLLLVPNNIILGICSIFLIEHPGISLISPGRTPVTAELIVASETAGPAERAAKTWLVAAVFLACNLAGFLSVWTGISHGNGEGSLWAMACLSLGALFGFMFGVPKLNRTISSRSSLVPNTNIEEVSDWLTKIVVGIGLVNFKAIAEYLQTFSIAMARSLAISSTFALALIIYFSTLGLIEGYVLTRMFLAREFDSDDHANMAPGSASSVLSA